MEEDHFLRRNENANRKCKQKKLKSQGKIRKTEGSLTVWN